MKRLTTAACGVLATLAAGCAAPRGVEETRAAYESWTDARREFFAKRNRGEQVSYEEAVAVDAKLSAMLAAFRASDWEHWPDWTEEEIVRYGLVSLMHEASSAGDAATAVRAGEALAAHVPSAHFEVSLLLPWACYVAQGTDAAIARVRAITAFAPPDQAALPLEVLGDLEALRGDFDRARDDYARALESHAFIRSAANIRAKSAASPGC